jgi:nucleotide-binding universal stress UspA family protein
MLSIKNVLVTTDISERSEAAFAFAASLARQHGSTLHLLYVETFNHAFTYASDVPLAIPSTQWMDDVRKEREAQLLDSAKKFGGGVSLKVIPHFRVGPPAVQIIACAKEVSADCIVMSTHGRSGITRLLFGSVTEQVLRESSCPVLCVKPGEKAMSSGPVLLTTDLSPESLSVLPYAKALAREHNCELHVATVLEDLIYLQPEGIYPLKPVEWMIEEHRSMENQLRQLAADLCKDGINAVPHIKHGHAAKEINQLATEIKAACIVLATHGRSGLGRMMLGSVAEDILRGSKCPVLALKATLNSAPAESVGVSTSGKHAGD